MINRTLENLIELGCNVKIYVPSTCNVNDSIDNKKYVDNALSFLSDKFDGATSYEALGCWKSPVEGLVKEKVTVCESFTDSFGLSVHMSDLIIYCEKLKSKMSQEAIALEVNNKLYFV